MNLWLYGEPRWDGDIDPLGFIGSPPYPTEQHLIYDPYVVLSMLSRGRVHEEILKVSVLELWSDFADGSFTKVSPNAS